MLKEYKWDRLQAAGFNMIDAGYELLYAYLKNSVFRTITKVQPSGKVVKMVENTKQIKMPGDMKKKRRE